MNLLRLAVFATLFVQHDVIAAKDIAPAWTLDLRDPGEVVQLAWASSSQCVAVATPTTVYVIGASGQRLWTWNYHRTNRLIRVGTDLAVSPDCTTVAIVGTTEYKYVWTATRDGRHAFLKTVGTPSIVRFTLRGDSIAVSTAAPHGYVLSPALRVRWSGSWNDFPVTWPGQTPVTTPYSFLREDIEALFDVGRTGGWDDSVSDDGQWRVESSWPYRGADGTAQVELRGPHADGYRGRLASGGPRWVKAMGCPQAEITLDGTFIVVTGDPNHAVYRPSVAEPCDENLSTYVFDRDGHTVLVWPYGRSRSDLADTVFAETGVRLMLQEPGYWDVPLTPEEIESLPDPRRRVKYTADRKMLLVTRDGNLRLYRLPD